MGLRFPRCHDANGKSSMAFVFDALSEIPQAAGTMKMSTLPNQAVTCRFYNTTQKTGVLTATVGLVTPR